MKTNKELNKHEIRKFYSDALVWDNNLSWSVGGYGDADHILQFKDAGVDVIALSVAFRDIEGISENQGRRHRIEAFVSANGPSDLRRYSAGR